MPDKSEMSESENEEIRNCSDDEDMVNQELENLKNDSRSPTPQVRYTNKPLKCLDVY